MSLSSRIKHASIASGLYRPARWLSRRLRPGLLRSYTDDVAFLRSLLPPDALCFDIGANVGEKSEALLEAGAQVVAFEPNPLVLPELRARCGGHEHWKLVPAAMGRDAAISTLYVCASARQSSLLRGWEGDVIGTCYVPVVSVDVAIRAFGRPYYCKIDVEGWELEVLEGLTHPVPLLSFEFHLTTSDILKTLRCLKRLRHFGPGSINITAAERSRFLFPEWLPIEKFLEWFPGNLRQAIPDPFHGTTKYGDIFVRSAVQLGANER